MWEAAQAIYFHHYALKAKASLRTKGADTNKTNEMKLIIFNIITNLCNSLHDYLFWETHSHKYLH
jgi:hypothetical protein